MGTLARLAVAAAVAIALGCADAKISVKDNIYRYTNRICHIKMKFAARENSLGEAKFPV